MEADLLAAIAAEPDALQPRLIYADWLQAQNDPRGELIVVQVRLLERPDDAALRAREQTLTRELTEALLAQVAAEPLPPDLIARWHLGFVDALKLNARTIRLLRTTHRAWFQQPAFAVVRELDIDSRFARTLRFIRHLGLASTVSRLRFGERFANLEEPVIAAIAVRLPKLATLHLRARDVPVLAPLRHLRDLTLELRGLTEGGVGRILEQPWTLDTFGLQPGLPVADDVFPALAQLYNGTAMRSVKHFRVLGNAPLVNIIETLAVSKRVDTLERLTGDFYRAPYNELLRAERHRAALAKLTFAHALGQSDYVDVEGLSALGSFLTYRLARPADALPSFEHALRIQPMHANARHNLGVALRKLRRLDESLDAFNMLIGGAKTPTASMFNGRHYTLCELGRRDEARADLERAVQIDPNFADAWNNVGVERQYIGDVDGAFAAYRRCMELDAAHGYARRNEADLLLELGRAAEALTIYQALLATKPGNRSLLVMLAYAHLETRDVTAARALLDARLADPEQDRRLQIHLLRALALRELDHHAAARADLEVAAAGTDCPAFYAATMFVRGLDEWARAIPDAAASPREIADAVIAHGKTARPPHATAMHEASVDDQLDCAELALVAALRTNQRDLAVARARAAAALYAEQGPRYFRKWWQMLATIAAIASRELDDDARALLALVLRALRGRRPIADVVSGAR